MNMPLHPTATDIAIRLALTMLAGGIVGLNRGTRGHAAGFRTTILVCLAASIAMIQANILLPLGGKTSESFSVMDLMRLPLGILTGVGFIGGGTILKRGDLVTGVTTAATLWLVTVIGLCFGGGQLALGTVATVLAVFTLWALKMVDIWMPREHRARLVVKGPSQWHVVDDLRKLIGQRHIRARFQEQTRAADGKSAEYAFELAWRQPEQAELPLDMLQAIEKQFEIEAFEVTTDTGR
ncbi:MgtC/SapB family protein [Bradyrhizobium sp. S3.9.1]|uniref:MgtC/SapB family protein n=1 Tax=Bradyrhizobium sp. S3.9.1 TaxID=3156431 RepID=UPI00339121C0